MTIIDLINASSQSQWIEWTTPKESDDSVSRVEPFFVKFTKILDVASFSEGSFSLLDDAGTEVVDIFDPISVHNDYDQISKILELHLSEALDPNATYTFIIDGLYDAMGESQDQPHIVSFITNASDVDLVQNVSGPSTIAVVDRTISTAELVPLTNQLTGHQVFLSPADGSYNVATTVQQLTLTFSPADIEDVTATVDRRPISDGELPWEPLGSTVVVVDTSHVTIDLPSFGANYVEPGYEYRVTVTVAAETVEFHFLGVLDPMFATISSVLQQSPSLLSFNIAKQIYLSSAFIIGADPTQTNNPSKSAKDYALYSTLALLSPVDTMKSYSLADLSVTKRSSQQQVWAKLAEKALTKLQGGPRFLVKGSANTSPHAKRDFGSTKARIGK